MAEAVGSIIAIIQITDRVIGLCKFYIESLRDVPSSLRAMLLEISSLRTICENLDFLLTCESTPSSAVKMLFAKDGPIEGCQNAVSALEALLPSDLMRPPVRPLSKKRKMANALETLAWPLKESKAKKNLEEIARYKETLSLAITAESRYVVSLSVLPINNAFLHVML